MKSERFIPSLVEMQDAFGESALEAEVGRYVFGRLEELGKNFDSVTLASVAYAMGWTSNADRKKAIARALDHLALRANPILERQFLLWRVEQTSDVLEEPECRLSDADVRRALDTNTLVVPSSGEVLTDFLSRVTVEYVVTDYAKELAVTEGRV